MKKTIALLTVFLILVSCIVLPSCANDDTDGGVPSSSDSVSDVVDNGSDTDDKSIILDIPDDVKYSGDFIILTYETNIPEFSDMSVEKPDMIEQALMGRDVYVENLLGVDIKYQVIPGGYNERNDFSNKVRTSVSTGQKAYDLIAAYSLIPPNLALNNVLFDLNKTEYIDFTKKWYPDFMVDACTINNQMYFITGDASTNALYRMIGVAFDPSQLAGYNMESSDLYQMVYDGTWTYENWFEMCLEWVSDGGDGAFGEDDFYPIQSSESASLDAIYPSAGLTYYDKTSDGGLSVSDDLAGDTAIKLYEMFYKAKHTDHVFRDAPDPKPIMNDKCVFEITPISNFRLHFNQSTGEKSYGILPMPKYEEGESVPYKTWLASHTQYCIPNDIPDTDRSAAVLEAMGYAGYTYVVPAVFEKTMKLQYSSNVDASNMFDILRNGRTYDAGGAFFMTFHAYQYKDLAPIFRNAVENNVENWTTNYKQNYEVGAGAIVDILNDFYGS